MTAPNPKDEIEFMENFHCQPDSPSLKNLITKDQFKSLCDQFNQNQSMKDLLKDLPDTPNYHCQPDKPLKKNFFDDSGCFPKTYQPEILAVPRPEIEMIIYSLEIGLENTQAVLIEHDASLGRTTKKNKSWAETLEGDIEFIKSSLTFLKEKLAVSSTHYP